ncbi:hypothetical protein O181_039851 [Austropuccinia psidii MF-1]|uniref:Uncharacterized protein n=1 Tax=Austropuccinia psidii MF-1 TaxID=1389203 RepID=A0A9Q3DGP2_9BASI|nr:hypothetical protein [Austropuccinia psidii MF-1]
MSLKAQTHFNTIRKVWVITPHGARKQFGMLIFVHEKTSTPRPDHLTHLPCLLSCLNWLSHPSLILSDPWQAYVPTLPSRCDSDTAPPHLHPHHSLCSCSALPKCPQHHLPSLLLCSSLPTCLRHHPHTGVILNAAYDPYAPAAPSRYALDAALNPP